MRTSRSSEPDQASQQNRNDVHDLSVTIPNDAAEQAAVGAILTHMDAEITALELKLAKTREIKQGVMQNLLTGKIRLISAP